MKSLAAIPSAQISHSISAVRARWVHLQKANAPPATANVVVPVPVDDADDEDEYQPDEGADFPANALDPIKGEGPPPVQPLPPPVPIGPYYVPQPPPLTPNEVVEYSADTVSRVFAIVSGLQEPTSKVVRSGFNRVAASTYDRDSWITVVSRLAARALAGLPKENAQRKAEGLNGAPLVQSVYLSDKLRESIYRYVLEDWRKRLDVAVTWLNEEWYNDQISQECEDGAPKHYEKWVLKVFDGILPYLDGKDKVLIRFLSEIPSVNDDILERVKKLARDPERVSLAVNSVHYLALFRPPVRAMCIDALEDLYINYDDARVAATKPLQKWKPSVLQQKQKQEPIVVKAETHQPTPTPTQTAVAV